MQEEKLFNPFLYIYTLSLTSLCRSCDLDSQASRGVSVIQKERMRVLLLQQDQLLLHQGLLAYRFLDEGTHQVHLETEEFYENHMMIC